MTIRPPKTPNGSVKKNVGLSARTFSDIYKLWRIATYGRQKSQKNIDSTKCKLSDPLGLPWIENAYSATRFILHGFSDNTGDQTFFAGPKRSFITDYLTFFIVA